MSFIGALKLAQATAKTSTLFKVGKGIFTVLDVTDVVMDSALLSDEIARAAMGENYDPAVRDLTRQVVDEGKAYDAKMTQVAKANEDIGNLSAGVNALHGIVLDYGDKQELVIKQLEKLDKLKQILNGSVPTTYAWFQTIRARAISTTADQKKLEEIKARLGPNHLSIALYSAGLGFRAITLGYDLYKKRKAANQPPPGRRAQPDAFDGVDAEEVAPRRQADVTSSKRLKANAIMVGKTMYKGVTKLMTVGSFGMNIYTVVMKVQTHDKAMADLNEMLTRYRNENPIYDYALNGCLKPDETIDEGALQKVATFFEIQLNGPESRRSLAEGYYKTLGGYESNITQVLDGIDGAYQAMLNKFQEAALEDSDHAVTNALQNSYDNFLSAKQIGLDKVKASETRKNSLDRVRDEFTTSVSNKLNEILTTLTVELDDHNSLNQLIVSARELNKREAEIETKYQTLKAKYPTLSDEILQDLVKTDREALQADICAKAESALSLLNITARDRSKFKSADEICEALKKLMHDLKTTPPTAA